MTDITQTPPMDEALVEKVARAIYEVFPDRSWDSVLRGVSAGLEGLIWEYEDTMLRARAAIQAAQEAIWRPVNDDTPRGEPLILGYWAEWPKREWVVETAPYCTIGSHGSRSFHSWATHWMPLPLPPSKGGGNG